MLSMARDGIIDAAVQLCYSHAAFMTLQLPLQLCYNVVTMPQLYEWLLLLPDLAELWYNMVLHCTVLFVFRECYECAA